MTADQGSLPQDPQKSPVLGPLSTAPPPEDDDGFWDLDRENAVEEGVLDSQAGPPKASVGLFAKGDAPEVAQKLSFSPTPLEPREPKVENPFMVQADPPHGMKSGKPSRDLLLSRVDDAFSDLESGELEGVSVKTPPPQKEIVEEKEAVEEDVDDTPVFAIGEAPPIPVESVGGEKHVGFAEETVVAESGSFKALDLPKSFAEWMGGFSWMEKVSMLVVIVLLAGFAVLLFFPAIGSLPDEKQRARAEDFPKKGKHLTVKSALTYWREPIENGPNADVFKRGTALLPAIQIEVEGGPAVLRILFRGEDGVAVGDSVTREVNGNEVIKLAGTEGFLELGMHAAYRTGQTKPWMVQVYEAKPGSKEIQDFVLIFEMDMSALLQ